MRSIYFACCIVLVSGATKCKDEKVFRGDYQYFAEAGGWFKLHHMPIAWQEARLRCAYEGAMVASPTTYGLDAVIRSFAAKHKVVVYTGIHATLTPGDFNAMDGTPLFAIQVKWKPGNPDNQNNNEQCIVYHGDGLLEDVDCSRDFPYICYRKHSKKLVMTECGTTDRDYKLHPILKKCYKLHRFGRPYEVAAGVCSAEGGHLAIINSIQEGEVLKELFAKNPEKALSVEHSGTVHLGFYNWHTSNYFGTLQGQTLKEAGYDKWKQGEPSRNSGGKRQACGAMFRTGLLDDSTCAHRLAFICEKDPDALRKSIVDIRFGQDNY